MSNKKKMYYFLWVDQNENGIYPLLTDDRVYAERRKRDIDEMNVEGLKCEIHTLDKDELIDMIRKTGLDLGHEALEDLSIDPAEIEI